MKKVWLLGVILAGALCCAGSGSIYHTGKPVAIRSSVDRVLDGAWRNAKLSEVLEASDSVLVRRLHLDLAGRLPTPQEAQRYLRSTRFDKYELLVDALLEDPGFVASWSMRFGDMLRVKSEFPINLWPNAVYVYMRRIREFLHNDEPYNDFVRELLLASGSNFRDPCVNFHRAHADRSPRGIAADTLLTLCGIRLENWSAADQAAWVRLFEEIGFKSTKEWKEEIVYLKKMPARDIVLPDGKHRTVPAGGEARLLLADYLTAGEGRRLLARTLVNRTWQWFFGATLYGAGAPPGGGNLELLELLTDDFMEHKFNFRHLCRVIATSAAYRSASLQPDAAAKLPHFAAYPVRRLEAEVLDDAFRDLTGVPSSYSSVIPEPFTFIPGDMRTVEIADGSISSSFLILFGRPSRDAGTPEERNDAINAKQRLFLFNSGALYYRLMRILRRPEFRRQPPARQAELCYWLFYARPPTEAERKILIDRYNRLPRKTRWKLIYDLLWTLANSAEFLYRH